MMEKQGEALGELSQQLQQQQQQNSHDVQPSDRLASPKVQKGPLRIDDRGDEQAKWTEVVKCKGRGRDPELATRTTAEAKTKTRPSKPAVKMRTPAILVEAGTDEFPAPVKKIRSCVNRDFQGTCAGDCLCNRSGCTRYQRGTPRPR